MITLSLIFLFVYCRPLIVMANQQQSNQNAVTMAALGRPFDVGMLYDMRTDQIISGITLWDPETLSKNIKIVPLKSTKTDVITEDTFENKAHALGVQASLKLSMLGGLIDIHGSAKYVEDRQKTNQESRLTFQYKTTTHDKSLTMAHLGKGKLDHPDVHDLNLATHVVTGVTYGAEAFFVFERSISKSESKREISGSLKALIQKIPTFGIGGGAQISFTEQEKHSIAKLNCKFYGDFRLQENPTTFIEAVKAYRELPKLLGENNENAVAKTVKLLPLGVFDNKAARYVREISSNLIDRSISMVEELRSLEIKALDFSESEMFKKLSYMKDHFLDFAARLSEFQREVKQNIAVYLPKLRGNTGIEESVLFDYFKQVDSSPYNLRRLKLWLKDREKEVALLSSWIDNIVKDRNLNITIQSSSIHKFLGDTKYEYIVCLLFRFVQEPDPQVNDMYNYRHHRKDFNSSDSISKAQIWFNDLHHIAKIRNRIQRFVEFAAANIDGNRGIKFIVDEEYASATNKDLEIILYDKGAEKEGFVIPSKPGAPYSKSVTHNSILLEWTDEANGTEEIKKYRVMYRKHDSKDSTDDDDNKKEGTWAEAYTVANEKKIMIKNLSLKTAFEFKVQSITAVGFSAPSSISTPIQTLASEQKTV